MGIEGLRNELERSVSNLNVLASSPNIPKGEKELIDLMITNQETALKLSEYAN